MKKFGKAGLSGQIDALNGANVVVGIEQKQQVWITELHWILNW